VLLFEICLHSSGMRCVYAFSS